MAGWDFTADSEVQKDLAQKLNKGADQFDLKIGDMYNQIDSLGTYWVGEDYDAYKTGTEGYKTALQDLSDGIRMFGEHFNLLATGTEELASDLISVILNATGSSAAGGTGGSGTGTTGGYGTPASGTLSNNSGTTGGGTTANGGGTTGGSSSNGGGNPGTTSGGSANNGGGNPGTTSGGSASNGSGNPGTTGGTGNPNDNGNNTSSGSQSGLTQQDLRTQTNSNGSYNPYGGETRASVSGDDNERTYTYYDANGNKMQEDVWDNGVLESRKTYDGNQNINYQMTAGGAGAILMAGGAIASQVQGGTYNYNSDGSYTISKTENGATNVYTFDKDNRFVRVEQYYGGTTTIGSGSGSTSSNDDPTGYSDGPSVVVATPRTQAYTIRRGDQCGISYNGQNVETTFWATDESSGSNFYKYVDATGRETVLKQNPDGSIEDLGISTSSFTVGYAEDHVSMYSGITTNAEDAAKRNLPTQVTAGSDDFDNYSSVENVYYGDPRGENIGGSIETYKVRTNDDLYSSAKAHTPVLEINTAVDVPFLSQGSDLNKGRNTMYLVWDEDSGQYYELENGQYTRGGRGFTPEELEKCKLK